MTNRDFGMRQGRGIRALMMVGTALAGGVVTSAMASAENIASAGSTSYSLTRTDTVSGGPQTINVSTSGGDITLNLATVEVANSGGTPGVAISAVNSGTGNVSITESAINGTGTTESAGISTSAQGNIAITSGIIAMNQATRSGGITAETATGTLTIGSTDITSGNATAIAAYARNVTINSGTIDTRSIGIDAGNGGSSVTADTVQVTSGTINVNGAGSINAGAIQAGGRVVNVTSGTIVTAGLGNRFGISAQATGTDATSTVTVQSGSVTTVGNGAYGIAALGSTGAVNITSTGTITTVGTTRMAGSQARYSAGIIGVSNTGSVTIDSNNITTLGAASDGIRVETGSGIASYNTPVSYGTAPATVTSRGTISTTGSDAAGIRILPGSGNATVTNLGTINTTGTNGYGIFVDAKGGATSVTSNIIKTTGDDADGISIGKNGNSAGTIAINSTRVDVGDATGIIALGREVNITSGLINTNFVGIETSTTNDYTPDLVKIVSGTINLVGLDNFNGIAISAGGNVVDVTSDTIVTSGTGNRFGISAQAVGTDATSTATVRSGSISTVGNGAYGISALGYNGAVNVTSTGTISTVGTTRVLSPTQSRYSAGIIGVSNTGSVTIDSNNITTLGAASDGIRVETGSGIVSFTPATTPGTAPATVTSRGTISTAGAGAAGIRILSGSGNATVANSGTIITSGTTGHGIAIDAKGGDTTVSSNIIKTTGSGANGILIGESGIDTGAIRITSAKIDAAATGIVATTTGPIEVNSTDIVSHAYGMNLLGSAGVVVDSGTINTVVPDGSNPNALFGMGIAANSSGPITITSQQITMSGPGTGAAYGIGTSSNGTGATTIVSGSVTSFGNGYGIGALASAGGAINITSTGAVVTTGTTRIAGSQPRYANGIWAVSALGDISIANSGSISTSGASSSGIGVESGSGATSYGTPSSVATDKTVTINSTGSITTAGANAYGINIASGGNAVDLTSGTVTTSGAGAHGIHVVGTGTVKIAADTTNSAASGIYSRGGTTTLTAASTSSTADGQHAIDVEALSGTITATIGSAKATGAGADAVHLVANGSGGAVTATVTGTLSAISGTGLFIDPPGTVNITIASSASVSGSVAGINTLSGSTNAITNNGSISTSGTGAAIVASGQTSLTNSGVISTAGAIAVQLGATDDVVTLGSGSNVTGSISGGGGTDRAVLAGTGTTRSFAQTVAAFAGFDSLTVQSGYWTAGSTASAFNSATIASGGTLELGYGATGIATATSSFTANGTLAIRTDASATGSALGSVTVGGSGNVLFTGAGTALLDGNNAITTTSGIAIGSGTNLQLTGTQGGTVTTLAGGTFTIGNGTTAGSFTGNVVDNGTLVINHSDDYTFAGALTGAGNLVKSGTGKLIFGTGYGFTGTTTINSGSIKLAGTVAPTTEIALEGSGTLDFSGSRQTIAELAGSSRTASIDVSQGAITVNQTTATAFAGAITGDGALTKTGSGSLNLTGNSTYTGPTTVSDGRLAVNGSIVSPVTVQSGARLGGTGSVGGAAITTGGIYAPGNSIGTQTVNGNVAFAAGSVYEVETNADGRSDRVNATGTATISGGAVRVLAEAGTYNKLTAYTILTAAGGVSGTFTGTTSNYAFLDPLLGYSANAVTLTLVRNDLSFAGIATSDNQRNIANAVQSRGLGNALYNAVLLQTADNGRAAFDALSGELHATVPSLLLDGSRRIRDAVIDRAHAGGEGIGVWGQLQRNAVETSDVAGIAKSRTDRKGIVSGVDYASGDGWRAGIHAGYLNSRITVGRRASRADVDSTIFGIYGGWFSGPLTITAGADYVWHKVDTRRTVSIAGLAGTTSQTAKYDADSRQGYIEASYVLIDGPAKVAPFVSYNHVSLRTDAFSETGNAAALTVSKQGRAIDLIGFGGRMTGDIALNEGLRLQPHFAMSAQLAFGDRKGAMTAALSGGGAGFTVRGARIGGTNLNIDGGLDFLISDRFRIGAGGFMSASSEFKDYGANVTLGFRF